MNTKMDNALPTSPLELLQKAIYLFQKTSYCPCGTFLFRTKPIFALNACVEQQALDSVNYVTGGRHISYKVRR